ncbi:MAG TPA: hypothetical protein PLN25_02555 [Deltaproteobacteria bacterium]|nr:hypothetical protein [Deltaproteobacteria bacterium]HQB37717.1 hypothetical protein [Deltaproteobacteria bacterium]
MAGYQFEVYVDTTGFCHAFIGLYGPNGKSEVWGYYPENTDDAVTDPSSNNYLYDTVGVMGTVYFTLLGYVNCSPEFPKFPDFTGLGFAYTVP